MARSVYYVNYDCGQSEAENRASQILIQHGFHAAEQDGLPVWTKGDVKTTGVKGIQIDYGEDRMKISGWIQGLIGGEVQLEGFTSMIPKKAVKKTIEEIKKQFRDSLSG